MGHSASSTEASRPPRKTSHKLSKPRVGHHASPTAGLLSSNSCLAPSVARQPDSHDSGGGLLTRPSNSSLTSPPSISVRRFAPVDLETDWPNDSPYRHPDSTALDTTNTLSSRPSQTEQQERRRRASTGSASPPELACVRRVHSVAYPSTGHTHHPSLTIPRNHSTTDERGIDQASPRLHLTQSVNMPDRDIAAYEPKYAVLENTWKHSHPTTHPTSPTSPRLFRVSSDISLYAPVRHRSLIRTPGVATRAPSLSELSRRSSSNLASAARHSRNTSFEPGSEVICVLPRLPEPGRQRAVTPTKFDYRQLGTMEFGSLRITNGAPSPSGDRKQAMKDSSKEVVRSRNGTDSNMDAESNKVITTGLKIAQPRPISAAVTPINAAFLKLESADPGSSGLQPTSKHTAIEDKLFEEEISSNGSKSGGSDAHDEVDGRTKGDAETNTNNITRSDSGFISSPTSETSHKPFSKTDSGYSSNVSLRSLRNSKAILDKKPPPVPDGTSTPSAEDRSSTTASSRGSLRLPSSRPISFESLSASASPGQDARPPPPPPKDISPDLPTIAPSVAKSTATPFLNAPNLGPRTKQKAEHQPSILPITGRRTSGPTSPNSIQLSPALSSVSGSATLHQAAVQKPGSLKRLLGVTSRAGSRSSLGSLPFRYSGSSSGSRESSTGTSASFFTKSSNDFRRTMESALATMKPAHGVDSSRTVPPPPASSEKSGIRRHRSFQSIPTSIVNAAASIFPSRKSLRKSTSSSVQEAYGDEHDNDITEVNERWSRTSSSEIDIVYTEDYTGDSLMRNGFDPSFMAMKSVKDAYFSPAPSRAPSRARSRAGSVTSPSVDVRLAELYSRTSTESPVSFSASSPQSSSIPERPYIHSSHPLTRAQSVVQLRVPAPLRSHPTPSRLHRSQSQTLYLDPSHELAYSYPPTMIPCRSSVDGTRSSQETQQRRHRISTEITQGNEDTVSLNGLEISSFPPRRPDSHHSRANSVLSQGSSIGVWERPMSINPHSEQQMQLPGRPASVSLLSDRLRQGPSLRHRASYEGQSSKPRKGQAYRRQSPNLWTSTHYEQLQMQYGGTAFDPQQGWYPPHVPRSGHNRNQSMASQRGSDAPYRVLHSYYSPAYRHVPIWG